MTAHNKFLASIENKYKCASSGQPLVYPVAYEGRYYERNIIFGKMLAELNAQNNGNWRWQDWQNIKKIIQTLQVDRHFQNDLYYHIKSELILGQFIAEEHHSKNSAAIITKIIPPANTEITSLEQWHAAVEDATYNPSSLVADDIIDQLDKIIMAKNDLNEIFEVISHDDAFMNTQEILNNTVVQLNKSFYDILTTGHAADISAPPLALPIPDAFKCALTGKLLTYPVNYQDDDFAAANYERNTLCAKLIEKHCSSATAWEEKNWQQLKAKLNNLQVNNYLQKDMVAYIPICKFYNNFFQTNSSTIERQLNTWAKQIDHYFNSKEPGIEPNILTIVDELLQFKLAIKKIADDLGDDVKNTPLKTELLDMNAKLHSGLTNILKNHTDEDIVTKELKSLQTAAQTKANNQAVINYSAAHRLFFKFVDACKSLLRKLFPEKKVLQTQPQRTMLKLSETLAALQNREKIAQTNIPATQVSQKRITLKDEDNQSG